MVDKWRKIRLGELCTKIGSGATPRGGKETYKDSGISLIRSQNVLDFEFSVEGLAFIDTLQAEQLKNVCVENKDVLINITGDSVARACLAPKQYLPARVNQHVAIIRVIPSVASNHYILYFLHYIKPKLLSIASTGGTRNALTKAMLENLEINLPTLSEQRRIAAILSALDDKIELNNQINKNLEAQAQAIFKSWFVDFEPWGGAMPEDWREGTLGEIIELFDSKRIPLSARERENLDKIYPYYGATSIMDYVDGFLFDGTYILMGEDGSVIDEKYNPILQFVWGKFWVNNHAHVIKGKNGFSDEYILTLLKCTNVKKIVTGAVQLKINQGNLCSLKVLIPDAKIVEKFNVISNFLYEEYKNNYEQNQVLIAIRNSLLPKLMSGKIKLPPEA